MEGADYRTLAASDTLRLDRMAPMAFDVTDGDAHVQLVTPGRIQLRTTVKGATGATALGAEGRHVVISKGGNGIEPREQ